MQTLAKAILFPYYYLKLQAYKLRWKIEETIEIRKLNKLMKRHEKLIEQDSN